MCVPTQATSSAGTLIQQSYDKNKKCLITLAEKAFYSRTQCISYPKNSKLVHSIDRKYNMLCYLIFHYNLLNDLYLLSYIKVAVNASIRTNSPFRFKRNEMAESLWRKSGKINYR